MTAVPRVSVVVPTRNRAVLLRCTLEALGGLDGDDVEIVVSDNASTDGTAALLKSAPDSRIRVVSPGRALDVVDHWEFAVAQSRGEWVMVIGDDDAVVPSLLSRVRRHLDQGVRVVAWQKAWYVHPRLDPEWQLPASANHLIVHPFGASTGWVDARSELARFMRRREGAARPEMNALVHRDVLHRIRTEMGRVFLPADPAVSLCAAVLALEPRYLAVEAPLSVMGLSAASISTAIAHDLGGRHEVVREFDHPDLLTRVPLQTRTVPNLVAESLLAVRDAMPGHFGDLDLDLVSYFVTCREAIPAGASPAYAEWREALARQPRPLRLAVTSVLVRGRARALGRAMLRRVPDRVHPRRARLGSRGRTLRVIDGAAAGFTDLAGAVRHLDGLLPVLPARTVAAA